MPTFTTIALENLLEHRNSTKISNSVSNSSTLKTPNYVSDHEEQVQEAEDDLKLKENKRLNHIYISPALYTTPEPTPILDYNSSSGSVSPSPYVFNRKGRGGGGSRRSVNRRIDGFEVESGGDGGEGESENCLVVGGGGTENCFLDSGDGNDDGDTFGDPRCDSMSIASLSDLNDPGRLLGFENMSVVSNQVGEFYDAIEDFSSDGSMLSCSRNLESELHTARLTLIDETGKRKMAEDDLATMCAHWQRFGKLILPHTGQTSFAPSHGTSPTRFDINEVHQFSQEVIFVRYVTEAIEKDKARAEAELAAEVIIGAKDKEISRLKDRLQYYETMTREMSQKNLESMEVARRQRDRKRGQKKWLWSCIGVSIVIGASVIAYSYAPQHHALQNVSDIQQPDAVHD